MTTFYTSDQHFGHANIIDYCGRPFGSVEEMNHALIERWNAVVSDDDTVWCLGDLALGQLSDTVSMTSALKGRRLLVPGNHDRISSVYKDGSQRERFLSLYQDAGWQICPEIIHTDIGGHAVVVSHFPYVGDSHGPDRFQSARATDEGLPIIHGHVHEEWRANGKQFNVGVDVHDWRPITERVIVDWLNQLPR